MKFVYCYQTFIMSLEIRSIGEVISYQSTPRSEFVVGTGIIKSKTNENENITFEILQFIPVDVEVPCHCVPISPKDVIYFYGTVTNVNSSTQTISITCHHTQKILLDPSAIPHDFTHVTAVGTVTGAPNITETTASFDVSLSQYIKTNTGGVYQPFTVTAFHSIKNTRLLNRTKVYNSGTRIKIEGAVELYNDIIYCEVQNSTFVIPKNTSPVTDQNNTVVPSQSRRATIVRNIAQKSPPTKKPRLTTSETDSSHSVSNEEAIPEEETGNDTHTETIEKPPSNNNRNTSRSRRTTLRDLASQKLIREK